MTILHVLKTTTTHATFVLDTVELYLSLACLGDGGHVKELSGVILHTAEENNGDRISLLFNHAQDVLRPQCVLTLEDWQKPQRVPAVSSGLAHGSGRL